MSHATASPTEPKATLHRYLHQARDTMLWKLEGLGEYDVRRPLTPTGTNLLGLVKHLATVEAGYFGTVFGRPWPEPMPWIDDDAEIEADMWARPEEARADVVDLYRRVCAHSDTTIESLGLDVVGHVPHWPAERATVTLHQVLVHMIAETNRHGGHADVVRELIDGTAGLRRDVSNLGVPDAADRRDHHDRLERAARRAAPGS